jgi:hypothetical protein
VVKGLDKFRAHFEGYVDHYILIGGTACDLRFTEKGLDFRATKDFDIILVVEALTDQFVQHFWDFIRAGSYEVAQIDEKKRFYRFHSPKSGDHPVMLELFSRQPEILQPVEDLHITDIPTGEAVSSLSAILLEGGYYQFTLENSDTIDGIRMASDIALIALKTRAFLNNRQRKAEGQTVHEVDISKHRNDVIRLTATVGGSKARQVPEAIRNDIAAFIAAFSEEADNVKALLKPWGLSNVRKEDIITQLRDTFDLNEPSVAVAEATVA